MEERQNKPRHTKPRPAAVTGGVGGRLEPKSSWGRWAVEGLGVSDWTRSRQTKPIYCWGEKAGERDGEREGAGRGGCRSVFCQPQPTNYRQSESHPPAPRSPPPIFSPNVVSSCLVVMW